MNKLLTTMYALAATAAMVLVPAAHAQEIKGDAKAGEKKIDMCLGCHGIQGYQSSFPEIYKVPKISGQSGKYLSSALAAYRSGDRKHPTMRAIAASLTDQDIADVAAYYEQHGKEAGTPALAEKPSKEPSAQVDALLKKGVCFSCHGTNFSKPIDPSYPKLAGQNADYLFVALKAYKTENNPQVGRSNGIMAGVAKQFTNAELKAMAQYIGSLDGDVLTVPESRFHKAAGR